MERSLAIILLILLSPLFLILYLLVKLSSSGPFIFKQKRLGKNQKPFYIYKIKTMVENAEEIKSRYSYLNEADGPVFKIKNDPRYTKIGRLISEAGLDELSQLINILKGEMSFIGPRPLPVDEGSKVPTKYNARFSVLPGITSLWVVNGAHKLSFKQWMELDMYYVSHKFLWLDFEIIWLTIAMFIALFVKHFLKIAQSIPLKKPVWKNE